MNRRYCYELEKGLLYLKGNAPEGCFKYGRSFLHEPKRTVEYEDFYQAREDAQDKIKHLKHREYIVVKQYPYSFLLKKRLPGKYKIVYSVNNICGKTHENYIKCK